MTAINGLVDNPDFYAPPPATNDKPSDELGQGDFLELMIAQFRNQDPFKPMENGEFLGQMAQFGTVSGIDEMNNSIGAMLESLQANQTLQAATLVGRSALVEAGGAYLPDQGSVNGGVEVPDGAGNVTVKVMDESGAVVKTLDLGVTGRGLVKFEWDGTDAGGLPMPAGQYRWRAQTTVDGQETGLTTYAERSITGVTVTGGLPTLETDAGEQIKLADVRAVT